MTASPKRLHRPRMVTCAGAKLEACALDLVAAAGVNTSGTDPQNACRYLVTSIFSGSVPVCTEKSMNF